jgi:hypothetical protein
MPSETVTLEGHILDSLVLSKVLDIILRDGGQYRVTRFDVGATRADPSHVEIVVSAPEDPTLEAILNAIAPHGARRRDANPNIPEPES